MKPIYNPLYFATLLAVVFLLPCEALLPSPAYGQPSAGVPVVSDDQRPSDWVFQFGHHKDEFYWKRQIETNLLWMIDRARRPVESDPEAPLVGVYADAGVWSLGAQSVVASLESSGILVELLDWSRLQRSDLRRYDAIIFPGGYSFFQQLSAGERGLNSVRAYVRQGGRYFGICAGGFLAAKDVHWEGVRYRYPLELFDGVVAGAIKEIAVWPHFGNAVLSVTAAGNAVGLADADGKQIYYQGGGRFLGGSDVTTLATYFDGSPAIIRRPFGPGGKGTVVLSGVHFERPTPTAEGRVDESDPPPALCQAILPALLGIPQPPRLVPGDAAFKPREFQLAVTAATTEGDWLRRQKELRMRLSEFSEPKHLRSNPVPTVLAKRGALILDDDGRYQRGGEMNATFDSGATLRAGAGNWQRVTESNDWRSTWTKGMGHTPVASYRGFQANNLVIEVTFRYGPITESWQHQCFRIAADNRPEITGHIVSAWANPNNDFIESGFLLQHIRKARNKEIIEDLLLDHQPITVEPNIWYTATLEIVGDEALFRMADHVAYAKADQLHLPKNLVSLTLGTAEHEIRRVQIWHAEPNSDWRSEKEKTLRSRNRFTAKVHHDGNE
ncbi:MAG: BPL-N domain-containing protein [Rubripirellula sp.]|nr:BPL-N domain-containing protein [Rubripirellula sp.]